MLAQNHKYDPFRHIHESFDLCVDAGGRPDTYFKHCLCSEKLQAIFCNIIGDSLTVNNQGFLISFKFAVILII